MKTAQEMLDFALKNGYGRQGIGNWGLKHFQVLEKCLHSDEVVYLCFLGYRVIGNDNLGVYAFAITDKRLIMAQKKVFGDTNQSVNLDNLNDVTKDVGALGGKIIFDTLKECIKVDFVHKDDINKTFDAVNSFLLDFRKPKQTAATTATSGADELLKYKQLLDGGVITQSEFDAKKKQLLGL